jgi:uncharacterized delta-60 repeat protein
MRKLIIFLLFCLLGSFSSIAQLYGLDSTFATNGIYYGDTGICSRLFLQPDGKILAIGQEWDNFLPIKHVRRFNMNGSVDSSFAINGRLDASSFNLPDVEVVAVFTQSDNKILLAGCIITPNSPYCQLYLGRIKPRGELDSSFGVNGNVIISLPGTEYFTSITQQPDGKIVAYGDRYYDDQIVVARFHANGNPDSSFGLNGLVISDNANWGLNTVSARGIAITADGRIVLGADATIATLGGASTFTAIRLLHDGNLDTSFNHTGIAYTNYNMNWLVYCKAMQLQPDGKVLLAGYSDSIAVVRFDTSGQLDASFGAGGVAKLGTGDGRAMKVQLNGKILVAGVANAGTPHSPGVVLYRLLPNGSIDNGFAMNGKFSSNDFEFFEDVVVQADSKILTCGSSLYNTSPSDPIIAIARFKPDVTDIIETSLSQHAISLYPNPVHKIVYIQNPTSHPISQLSLYSMDGALLRTLPGTIDRIVTEDLPNGMYVIRLRFADQPTLTRKLIIQHH